MKNYQNTSFLTWTKQFGTERDSLAAVAKIRWPKGFRCPRCGHDRA